MDNPLTEKQVRVVIVTDPMCSWCWGMSNDIDLARENHHPDVMYDLLLGGINTQGHKPIGEYGRRYLHRLWQEVAATTGQRFGDLVAEDYIHNSKLPCLALEAVRLLTQRAPFDFLRKLQTSFFQQQQNISDRTTLLQLTAESGYDAEAVDRLIDSPEVQARIKFQFDNAGKYGTEAMPSVLLEDCRSMRLLAGGYVDADMLNQLLEDALAHQRVE
ncbi:MAG: DsbA family protein [Pseudomonadaceae bacterium]|nr:DsbA family protein [Pseudomonadaceae bacterium]